MIISAGGFSFADSRGTALKKYRQYGRLVKERIIKLDIVGAIGIFTNARLNWKTFVPVTYVGCIPDSN